MPKKPTPDKKTRARFLQSKAGFRKAPVSINDLLARRPALTALAARVPAQKAWVLWFHSVLPTELALHIVNVVPGANGCAMRWRPWKRRLPPAMAQYTVPAYGWR
jgi:hypothetical protein